MYGYFTYKKLYKPKDFVDILSNLKKFSKGALPSGSRGEKI